jgi:hypothetical protein
MFHYSQVLQDLQALQDHQALQDLQALQDHQGIQAVTLVDIQVNYSISRMASSGMLLRVALVRTDVSEEPSASFIRVTRNTNSVFLRSVRRLLVAASVVPSSQLLVTLIKEALSSSETSVLTRATRRNIPEDIILHSRRRENLKSYIFYIKFSFTLPA